MKYSLKKREVITESDRSHPTAKRLSLMKADLENFHSNYVTMMTMVDRVKSNLNKLALMSLDKEVKALVDQCKSDVDTIDYIS